MDPALYPGLGRGRVALTGTTTVDGSYVGLILDCAGTFSLNFSAAATLGSQFQVAVYCTSGTVTLDPNGAETIQTPTGSVATLALTAGQGVYLSCDGTGLKVALAAGLAPASSVTIITSTIQAATSAGITVQNSTPATVMTIGSGPGAGVAFAGGITSAAITATSASGITTLQASTQDAIALLGRAGGTSSYVGTITPTTLTASRTYTMPDASIIVSGSASALTSGRVPYVTTGGLLTDAASLAYVAASHRLAVGDGTVSPELRLTAPAAGIAKVGLQISGGGERAYLQYDDATSAARFDSDGSLILAPNNTAYFTMSAVGALTYTGNISQTGATTFSTGTGAVSLNGATTVVASNNFTAGSGRVTVNGSTTASTLSISNSSNTSATYTIDGSRTVSTPTTSGVYRGVSFDFVDSATGTDSWFNQGLLFNLNITGTGSNSGYDRAAQYTAYYRGNGTRAAVVGQFVEAGTFNGGSDSTGTITSLIGVNVQALKTTSSTVTTSALLNLGANVGTTKYAILTASTSGIVSIGDTTASTSSTSGALVVSGGAGFGGDMTFAYNGANGGYRVVQFTDNVSSVNFVIGRSSNTYTTGGAVGWLGNNQAFVYSATTFRLGVTTGTNTYFEIANTSCSFGSSYQVNVLGTTDSTSTSTGALVVSGGINAAKNLIAQKGLGSGITSTATAAGTTTLTNTSTKIQKFTGTTTQTLQLPAANLFGAGIAVEYLVINRSTGTVTAQRAGSDTFDGGGTTDAILTNTYRYYVSDGVSVWSPISV